MSAWISSRLPTADDATDACVIVWRHEMACIRCVTEIVKGEPWQVIRHIEPYVAPKPKRAFYNDALGIPFAEVLPGDPDDLDELLAAIDVAVTWMDESNLVPSTHIMTLFEARKPKGTE